MLGIPARHPIFFTHNKYGIISPAILPGSKTIIDLQNVFLLLLLNNQPKTFLNYIMHKVPHSETDLLNLIAQGDEYAYQLIFKKYWQPIYNTAHLLTKSPALAEDIAQDVFAMLWEKRSTLTAVEKLEGFLFIAARNLIYSRMRKLANDKAYRQYILECFQEQQGSNAHEQTEYKELEQTILRTIHNLPPQQQKAFKLSRYQGMQHREIAHKMGVSPVTIKSYIVQAIAVLRRAVNNHPARLIVILWALSFLP